MSDSKTAARGRQVKPHKRILIFTHYFLPGFKAGGPVRSIANLVNKLGHEFQFLLVTSDRDFDDTVPFPGVSHSRWVCNRACRVWYSPPGAIRLVQVVRLLRNTPHDLLYLNSLFDAMFTLWPLVLRRLLVGVSTPVVLAPRGELTAGALGIKRTKKLFFLRIAKRLGLYRNIIWQATSEYEAADIRHWMSEPDRVFVAPNVPSVSANILLSNTPCRERGMPLRLVFLSRIVPKKNLDFSLRVLQMVKTQVTFSIFGPLEDEIYVARCRRLAAELPRHVRVVWKGEVQPDEVPGILATQDLFFLPTRGENFGHVIAEALSVGTPVLLSDTTPWRNLEAGGVGWDLPLDDPSAFVKCIERCAQVSSKDYVAWRDRARTYARDRLAIDTILNANRRLFLNAVGQDAQAEAHI